MKKLLILFLLLAFGCSASVDRVQPVDNQHIKPMMMYLTVPDMKRVDYLPIYSGGNEDYDRLLRKSALHVESTGYPWQADKNVYIAGHRLGYLGTDSYLVFADIHKLELGDRIYIDDDLGNRYEYRIYKQQTITPFQEEVLESKGEDTVTLQSCTYPNYEKRILVVGERI